MPKIALIHGPNLNLFGTRETNIYGSMTLPDIDQAILDYAIGPMASSLIQVPLPITLMPFKMRLQVLPYR